jgi:hypothetical protein
MILIITLLILAISIAKIINYSEIQFPQYWIHVLSHKAIFRAFFFDSLKTNFTTIVVIPFESKQFHNHYCKSV